MPVRLSVCLSSVTFVHPTQAIEFSAMFLRHLVRWPSVTFDKIFTEIVPEEPFREGRTS